MDGGPVPYGYQLDRDLDIPVPDKKEAAVVRQIFTAYARIRVGTRAIATALNQRGIRTKTGKPWSGYTIGRMLSNRVYLGEKVFGDIACQPKRWTRPSSRRCSTSTATRS